MFLGYIDPGSGFTLISLGGWLFVFLVGFLSIGVLFFKKFFRFLKSHKKVLIILSLIIIFLGVTMRGVIMDKKESRFDKKIVILGFDGLSPNIIEPMMLEGRLPNFSQLKAQGSYRHLSTTNPSQSPVAWAGFATGQNPAKNGIFDFIVRDPQTYGLSLCLSNIEKIAFSDNCKRFSKWYRIYTFLYHEKNRARRVIKSKCFWQYTSEVKIPTVIISCPVTFPPDKVYGRMLSGMGVPDVLGTEGTFSFYTTEGLDKDKDVGGKVFQVEKSPLMTINLIGPRVASGRGKEENVKVPCQVILQEDKDSVVIEYQNNKLELRMGQWSDWQKVSFKLGLLKRMPGIFKFYLIQTHPHFKLYVSPINFDPQNPYFPLSYPQGYSKELTKNIGLYYTQGMPMDTWAVNEKRLSEGAFLEQANEVLREKKAMLDFELSRFEKGVLFCYFESPDIIQHMFWRYTDVEHPLYEEDALQEYKEMIQSWYKKMDKILGAVLERLNQEDTLIVLSDHGFDTFRRAVHINSWLRQNGYLELINPYAESGAELLTDIDWSKTRAYAIGFGAIYINQYGRERDGIVKPGSEMNLLKEEIAQKLTAWLDEKYNQPPINRVYKREEIFWGDYANQAPELYLGFNIGYRASWQTALGAVPAQLIEDNLKKWSGDHLFDPVLIPGIIFSNREITKKDPSIYDIAPTVLESIGYDKEKMKDCDFDGESLFQ